MVRGIIRAAAIASHYAHHQLLGYIFMYKRTCARSYFIQACGLRFVRSVLCIDVLYTIWHSEHRAPLASATITTTTRRQQRRRRWLWRQSGMRTPERSHKEQLSVRGRTRAQPSRAYSVYMMMVCARLSAIRALDYLVACARTRTRLERDTRRRRSPVNLGSACVCVCV